MWSDLAVAAIPEMDLGVERGVGFLRLLKYILSSCVLLFLSLLARSRCAGIYFCA